MYIVSDLSVQINSCRFLGTSSCEWKGSFPSASRSFLNFCPTQTSVNHELLFGMEYMRVVAFFKPYRLYIEMVMKYRIPALIKSQQQRTGKWYTKFCEVVFFQILIYFTYDFSVILWVKCAEFLPWSKKSSRGEEENGNIMMEFASAWFNFVKCCSYRILRFTCDFCDSFWYLYWCNRKPAEWKTGKWLIMLEFADTLNVICCFWTL